MLWSILVVGKHMVFHISRVNDCQLFETVTILMTIVNDMGKHEVALRVHRLHGCGVSHVYSYLVLIDHICNFIGVLFIQESYQITEYLLRGSPLEVVDDLVTLLDENHAHYLSF